MLFFVIGSRFLSDRIALALHFLVSSKNAFKHLSNSLAVLGFGVAVLAFQLLSLFLLRLADLFDFHLGRAGFSTVLFKVRVDCLTRELVSLSLNHYVVVLIVITLAC